MTQAEQIHELFRITDAAVQAYMQIDNAGQGAIAWPVLEAVRDAINAHPLMQTGLAKEMKRQRIAGLLTRMAHE